TRWSRTCASAPAPRAASRATTKRPTRSSAPWPSSTTIRRCCRNAPKSRCCSATSSAPAPWPSTRSRWARRSGRCAAGTGPPSNRCAWRPAMPKAPPRPRTRSRAAGSPAPNATEMPVDGHVGGEGLAGRSIQALASDGPLARRIPGFSARQAQQRLAGAVADALEGRDALLAEAGTGTGKTFAYLVPLLLSGLRTIVSTGTRALQDQLYHRDLPRVRDALGTGLKTALLKGRSNYLCRYRLERAKGE